MLTGPQDCTNAGRHLLSGQDLAVSSSPQDAFLWQTALRQTPCLARGGVCSARVTCNPLKKREEGGGGGQQYLGRAPSELDSIGILALSLLWDYTIPLLRHTYTSEPPQISSTQ